MRPKISKQISQLVCDKATVFVDVGVVVVFECKCGADAKSRGTWQNNDIVKRRSFLCHALVYAHRILVCMGRPTALAFTASVITALKALVPPSRDFQVCASTRCVLAPPHHSRPAAYHDASQVALRVHDARPDEPWLDILILPFG
jgi:hypothetical protein